MNVGMMASYDQVVVVTMVVVMVMVSVPMVVTMMVVMVVVIAMVTMATKFRGDTTETTGSIRGQINHRHPGYT